MTSHRVAVESVRKTADRLGEAWVLDRLGWSLARLRDEEAFGYLEQALAIRRELGDRRGQAQTANNIAFYHLEERMYERAVPALAEALELQRAVGRRHGEGVALCNLGEAYLELGQYDEAISYLQQALPVARETGSSRVEGYVLQHLGRARLDQGRIAESADLLERAQVIHSVDGDKYGQARDLDLLGQARSRADQRPAARQAWQAAVRLFEGLGEDQQVEKLLAHLAGLGSPADDS